MAPYALEPVVGKAGMYIVYLLIGFSFGAVLEMAGFANARRLAAQFYFKDMTVLKVMFGAIIVAMLLIFWASGLGLLDYNRVWVNPTYLWPGILGGLIMGFGFIIGGFCPGTSLVAVATLKWDGIAFALGALTGIFLFGETVSRFAVFWNSSYLGRLTLTEVFRASTGVVVLALSAMAIVAFAASEKAERVFGGKEPDGSLWVRVSAATVTLLAAVGLVLVGQPTVEARWEMAAEEKQPLLDNREVQIHPGELLDLMADNRINLRMFDVRSESDFNLFHLLDAERRTVDDLKTSAPELLTQPDPTVVVLMGNDEVAATEAWKALVAQDVPNVYLLEGGVNYWLDIFGHEGHEQCETEAVPGGDELRHVFGAALGSAMEAAEPDVDEWDLYYEPKVELEKKKPVVGGGCG